MEDIEIINLLFERNEIAIIELKNKYEKYLRKISINILGDESDVEECLNDTYLSLWNAIPPTKPDNLLAYASHMVKNISINRVKYNKRKRRGGKNQRISFDELENCIGTGGWNLENNALKKDINDFLKGLKKEQRIFFVRRYWFLDSISAIARNNGCSEGKVKMSLYRTKTLLRKYLRRKGYNEY